MPGTKFTDYIGNLIYSIYSWCLHCHGVVMTAKLHENGSEGVVGGNVVLRCIDNVHIGRNSYINGGHVLASPGAEIRIGNNCMVSYGVHMRTDMHKHDLTSDTPMCEQGYTEESIVIGDNVWVGYGVQILSGVTVGSNCIIAAGAVVTKDIPSGQIWGGVPAHQIR